MILSLLFALTVQASDTQNSSPPPPAPGAPATGNADDNRRICRTTQVTGSRIAVRRICRTAAEWRRHDQNLNADMREQRDGAHPPSPDPLNPNG
jgi:predicted secreted protein